MGYKGRCPISEACTASGFGPLKMFIVQSPLRTVNRLWLTYGSVVKTLVLQAMRTSSARPSTRKLSSSGSKSFLRRLSDAFSSSSAESSSDAPSALAQQRREEALRERGLLPPPTAENPLDSPPSLEWDATALFEEVRLASSKGPSQQGLTAAEIIKKQWEQTKSEAGPSILRQSRFIEHIPAKDDSPPGIRTSSPEVSIQRSSTRRPSTSLSVSPRKPRPLGPRNRSDTKSSSSSSSSSSFPPPLPKGASPPVAFVTRSVPPTPTHSTSISQRSRNKGLPPIDVDWERQTNDPVADPVPRTRKPIQVTIHNRASLVIEAGQITDIESRRVTEMAFLDPL
ncbi:uncharacterized protein EV420DRAFT_89416 [Desarmillaria tabescens]|uniref:Uncharacterized protein n=1 Tax=Armillaria tabescens TaxID=1929756 RepID=A0AA39NQN8_ARMTA|nr:uncharacterized protein EV420DRAFT_89416 [Desarmillaria tabescens]KAK0470092.1 hypothetical protein EV420DRAFT_89416 [Desarmillaria tabescens]